MSKLAEFFQDPSGNLSSTRLVGIASGFTLVIVALVQALSPLVVEMNDRLVEALEYVTISCLLWAQVAKFAKKTTPGAPPADETPT